MKELCAKLAKADWIVFSDADSVLMPHFFEQIGSFIKQKI